MRERRKRVFKVREIDKSLPIVWVEDEWPCVWCGKLIHSLNEERHVELCVFFQALLKRVNCKQPPPAHGE